MMRHLLTTAAVLTALSAGAAWAQYGTPSPSQGSPGSSTGSGSAAPGSRAWSRAKVRWRSGRWIALETVAVAPPHGRPAGQRFVRFGGAGDDQAVFGTVPRELSDRDRDLVRVQTEGGAHGDGE